MLRASSPSRALGLLLAAAIVVQGPGVVRAAAPAAGTAGSTPAGSTAGPAAGSAAGSTTTGSTASGSTSSVRAPDAGPPPPPATPSAEAVAADPPPNLDPATPSRPALVAPPNNVTPTSPTAGMGGRLMSADDPEARRAKAELEGTAMAGDKEQADLPARLPPLQRGAWWSMFGAFALASAGGVFAGLAEVQEDKAQRVAITLDTKTGSQQLYGDVQAEYEDILRVGRRDAAVARGFLAAGAGFLVAGVVLFIVHAVRSKKAARRPAGPAPLPTARVGASGGGLEVRF